MKISELTQTGALSRAMRLPLSIAGRNMSVTLGQIIDAASAGVVPFEGIRTSAAGVTYVPGSPAATAGAVIFDTLTGRFHRAVTETVTASGVQMESHTYYADFDTRSSYQDDSGAVRADCLFATPDGRLWIFSAGALISAGLTGEQARLIRLSTPVEVASEEEMEQRIAAGEFEEGQIYFLAEEE